MNSVRNLSFLAFSLIAAQALALPTVGHAASAQQVTQSPTDKLKEELAGVGVEAFTSPEYKKGLVRHIVLFRYADDVTAAQKKEVKDRFLALQKSERNGKRYILSIETGAQNSGEGVDDSLEQAFVVSFKSQGDRNYYVGQPIVTDANFYDPNHQAFKEFVGPLLHKDPLGVLVFDFAVDL